MATLLVVATAVPASARDVADGARGTVAISASVAGQARLGGGGAGPCLWSNTATRLLSVTVADASGATRRLTPADGAIAAAAPDCAGAPIILAAMPGTDARSILISPL